MPFHFIPNHKELHQLDNSRRMHVAHLPSIQKTIHSESDIGTIREEARKEGMVTLRENAIKKLLDGTTTYQEVLRVTWEQM